MIIELDKQEMWIAEKVGEGRHNYAVSKGIKNAGGQTLDDRLMNVIGAQAEMAVCKALNKYWNPTVGRIDAADIPPNIQIRCTTRREGRLYVLPKHKDTDVYILVIKENNKFDIVGWIHGKDAKQEKYLVKNFAPGSRPEHDIYWIPQSNLNKNIKSGDQRNEEFV